MCAAFGGDTLDQADDSARANETDVREEIATPMLAALGYERGTVNNIAREATLAYERQFLE